VISINVEVEPAPPEVPPPPTVTEYAVASNKLFVDKTVVLRPDKPPISEDL
jgi:hypothetical protein